MLKALFYNITDKQQAETGELIYTVRYNATHGVFKGHFPGQPVVPGVFTLQIVHELAEEATGKKLRLTKAGKIKFLNMVVPHIGTELVFKLKITGDGNEYGVDATALFMNHPCLKINARYTVEL